MRSKLFFLFLTVIAVATLCSAQITSTTMVGTVTDTTGAAVVGAKVVATNSETNLTRTVQTNEVGTYRLEFLPVGKYQVRVSASGFKDVVRGGIELQVNEIARVDVPLSVGQSSETVTVNEAPSEVNTTTAEIGRTVQSKEIANLPLSQQAKLLRVLETGEFERVGASRTQRVSVRVISATNADIHADASVILCWQVEDVVVSNRIIQRLR